MDLATELKQAAGEGFFVSLAKQIGIAYQTAHDAVEVQVANNWVGEKERLNMTPTTRRAHVETQLRFAADIHRIDVTCSEENWWKHNVVTVGRFRLIQASNPDANCKMRPAGYKKAYAYEQLELIGFEEMMSQTLTYNDPHYLAVILHRAPVADDTPQFMTIRFPTPDLERFHPEIIDLMPYLEAGMAAPASQVEAVPELAIPKLKTRAATR